MAIKSADQISIVDLTDGYSVILTSDGYTFPGTTTAAKAGSCTTQVIAMCGSEQVSASVDLSAITAPTGITVTKNTDTTAPTLTITASTSFTSAGLVTIPVTVDGEITITKQFSVGIALTGATGGTGAAATNVILGMDSATVACTKDRAATAASTITIPFAGYQGTTRKACSCTVGTLPSGVTSSTNTAATTSADGSLVLAIASGANFGGTAASYDNVSITLSFTCNGITFTKMFTLSKSITGATGSTGAGANNVIIGNESVTIPCTKDGLVKSAMEITIPFAGYQGTSRRACTLTDPTLPSGMTKKSNTAATTSADGSFVITVAANGTLGAAATLNGEITLSFSCNGQTFVKKLSWAKSLTGATGATGAAGADAISIAITSSNGTIFKNSSIETTLTAHVYKAGVEVTGSALTALGTIKWYKDGSTTALSTTGPTLNISAGDVTNRATYIAQLEA